MRKPPKPRLLLIITTIVLLLISLLLLSATTHAAGSNRLRDLAAQKNRLFGFAIGWSAVYDPTQTTIVKAEANILTSVNNMKWACLQPALDVYAWNSAAPDCSSADADADFANANGMKMHGHTLVWHEWLPDWVKTVPFNQLEQVLFDHINTVVGHYRGRVQIWDVVNEAIKSECNSAAECGYRDQSSFDDGLNTPWYGTVGPNPYSYIVKSFQWARQADPNAILLYNDFNIETINPKSDFLYNEVKRWRQEGAPIQGIGIQTHLNVNFNEFQSFANNMKRFAKLGLDIYITELDVKVENSTQYAQQAEVYRRIVELCLAQSRCKAIQTWGWTDRYAYPHDRSDPLLFNECFQPKPAYQAVQRALGGQPDPFVMLQAEEFSTQNNVCTDVGQPGVCRGDENDPGEFIYNVDNGDWIKLNNVNLATGFDTLALCYSRGTNEPAGGELRLGSIDGPVVATFTTAQTTETWETNSFVPAQFPLAVSSGAQSLYFRFTGSGVGNFDSFVLKDANVAPPILTLEAEAHNGQQGVDTYATFIGYVDGGDWIKFDNVNLDGRYSKVRVRYAKGNTLKTGFEIRLDSPTGTRLAKFATKSTGSWDTYQEKLIKLSTAAGVHTLYVVFTGGGGVGNFDWFRLERKGAMLSSAGLLEADLEPEPLGELADEEASYELFLPFVNR